MSAGAAAPARLDFTFVAQPMRVAFGDGALAERLPGEVALLGLRRALVLSSPGHRGLAEKVAALLGPDRCAGVHAEARVHVPRAVADAAVAKAAALGADGCVAVGGGSAIGLGKAVALGIGLPLLAVPTTYAGSEMTPIWGLTEAGEKRTGRDPKVLARGVVYDPLLTLGLPPGISMASGLNAVAHAVEALYAPDGNPIVALMAEEGIRALAAALPRVLAAPADGEARAEALYGAWLCGACLGATTMGLHHKLCHTLGGSFDLPHAATHAVVLPHALAFNAPAAPAAATRVGRVLGVSGPEAAGALWDLARRLEAPLSLATLGFTAGDVDRAIRLATADPYANPRPVDARGITHLLADAVAGRRPGVRS